MTELKIVDNFINLLKYPNSMNAKTKERNLNAYELNTKIAMIAKRTVLASAAIKTAI
jgi:hypothetical protein